MQVEAAPATETAVQPSPRATNVLILFGRDEKGKPHASRFAASDSEAVQTAAGLMGMRVLPATNPPEIALAARLPSGRLFPKSGRAFCPFVSAQTFVSIEAAAQAGGVPEAVKVERADKPGKAAGKPVGSRGAAGAGEAAPDPATAAGDAPKLPHDWPEIAPGQLVLATTGGLAEGWFESEVVEIKADDLLILRWRDWAGEPLIVRRREHVALLHPAFEQE